MFVSDVKNDVKNDGLSLMRKQPSTYLRQKQFPPSVVIDFFRMKPMTETLPPYIARQLSEFYSDKPQVQPDRVAETVTLDQLKTLLEEQRLLLEAKLEQQRLSFVAKFDTFDTALRMLATDNAEREARLERKFNERIAQAISDLSVRLGLTHGAGLPPLDQIAKIEAQLFFNKGQKGKPGCRLKLYVWQGKVIRGREGNIAPCYIPLHKTTDHRGRQGLRRQGCLIEVTEAGIERLVRAGRVQNGDELAFITADNRLLIKQRDGVIDLGLPKSKEDDHADRASALRWFYPDKHRD